MIKPPMQQFLTGHSSNQAPRQLVKDCPDKNQTSVFRKLSAGATRIPSSLM